MPRCPGIVPISPFLDNTFLHNFTRPPKTLCITFLPCSGLPHIPLPHHICWRIILSLFPQELGNSLLLLLVLTLCLRWVVLIWMLNRIEARVEEGVESFNSVSVSPSRALPLCFCSLGQFVPGSSNNKHHPLGLGPRITLRLPLATPDLQKMLCLVAL